MEEYYAKKPEYKAVQQKRVEGGYTVLASAGLSAEDLENMSVSEFRTLEPLLLSIGATASARYMGGLQQEQGQCITRKQVAGGL